MRTVIVTDRDLGHTESMDLCQGGKEPMHAFEERQTLDDVSLKHLQ